MPSPTKASPTILHMAFFIYDPHTCMEQLYYDVRFLLRAARYTESRNEKPVSGK
jgi:hypothetical protein